MRTKFFFLSLALLALFLFPACNNKKSTDNWVVTERIQYDVTIHNSEPDMDWWVQNLEGISREKLLADVFGQVSEGKVKAYEFSTVEPYTTDDIKKMMRRVDTISVERPVPPYDLVDTVMVTEIRISDVSRLRFLEEWQMNEKTLEITKKVAGICPMVERFSDSGELRGYKPLFWVFFDEKYPAALKLK